MGDPGDRPTRVTTVHTKELHESMLVEAEMVAELLVGFNRETGLMCVILNDKAFMLPPEAGIVLAKQVTDVAVEFMEPQGSA